DADDLPVLRRRLQSGAARPGQRHRQGDLADGPRRHERSPVHQGTVRLPVRPESGARYPGPVNGWRIARIGGIPIRIDPTFFLIALLIGSSIYTSEVNTLRFPPVTTSQAFALALFRIVLFFLSILLPELAHAGMSRVRDIPVSGISIYMLGGATFTALEERGPADEFLITVVGPATSALLGGLFLFVHRVGALPGPIDDVVK